MCVDDAVALAACWLLLLVHLQVVWLALSSRRVLAGCTGASHPLSWHCCQTGR